MEFRGVYSHDLLLMKCGWDRATKLTHKDSPWYNTETTIWFGEGVLMALKELI